MPWVRLDEHMPDNPKVINLSDRAFRVYITSLCYCNANTTDGRVTPSVAKRLGAAPRHQGELVDANLWEPNGTGWLVHDYLDYQPSKEEVEELRRQRSEAGALGGRAKRKQT